MEKENNINFSEEEIKNNIPQKSKKPNWFVCFFLVLANRYFGNFIGKNLITGAKIPNRFLSFVSNIFFLTIKSLPIALFVSYFLITLPTWIFVLAIVRMASELLKLVYRTNQAKKSLAKRQKPIKYSEKKQQKEEGAQNHVKVYEYGADNTFYVYRWTTLIGDFFRYIVSIHFTSFVGKNVFTGEELDSTDRRGFIFGNILSVIDTSVFWIPVISCFFITAPTWLFILAIMAAASKLLSLFYHSYRERQRTMEDLFFCKCQGSDKWHASRSQVKKQNQLEVPVKLKFIKSEDVKYCADLQPNFM